VKIDKIARSSEEESVRSLSNVARRYVDRDKRVGIASAAAARVREISEFLNQISVEIDVIKISASNTVEAEGELRDRRSGRAGINEVGTESSIVGVIVSTSANLASNISVSRIEIGGAVISK